MNLKTACEIVYPGRNIPDRNIPLNFSPDASDWMVECVQRLIDKNKIATEDNDPKTLACAQVGCEESAE